MTDYFLHIENINDFLELELKDVIILPVLTSNIAIDSGNDAYSNFMYMSDKDYYSNNEDTTNYISNLEVATDNKNKEFAKSKLKHSIIKNMLYNNTIKTRQYAEYYFNTITSDEYKSDSRHLQHPDKIAYYLDFVNEYNLLTDVLDNSDSAEKAKTSVYALKTDISKPKNDKDLIEKATDTYMGPYIYDKYNLMDIVVLCGIIVFAILLYFLKGYIDIYLIGIILLMFLLCLVFLTVIFI
jgi:hypothetical protein